MASVTDLKALARDCQTMKDRSFKLFASTAEELTADNTKIISDVLVTEGLESASPKGG